MITDTLKRTKEAGRTYRSQHPKSTLADAKTEAWKRWPDAQHGLYRALFLTGWALAATTDFRKDSIE